MLFKVNFLHYSNQLHRVLEAGQEVDLPEEVGKASKGYYSPLEAPKPKPARAQPVEQPKPEESPLEEPVPELDPFKPGKRG